MNTTRFTMALCVMLCLGQSVKAQFDNNYDVEEWTLDLDEEEPPKPQHKEYKNELYLQYSPSRYKIDEGDCIKFDEILLGYNRAIQVIEDKPYFVEVGANMKFSWETSVMDIRAITFRIPVNVMYKIYPWKEKDIAIAPYAGASLRAIAMAREHTGPKSTNLLGDDGWDSFQVAWQVGLRFYWNHYFLGVSYTRDFRDKSNYPGTRECGIHLGYSF